MSKLLQVIVESDSSDFNFAVHGTGGKRIRTDPGQSFDFVFVELELSGRFIADVPDVNDSAVVAGNKSRFRAIIVPGNAADGCRGFLHF